jgi:multicomponent Na+:H+ antiporter subunit D
VCSSDLIVACIQADRFGYALCACLASILTLASFMKVQKYAFQGPLNKKLQEIKEVPLSMKLSMLVLAVICVFAGLMLLPGSRSFLHSASEALVSGTAYKEAVLGMIQ